MDFHPYGDSAVLVNFEQKIDPQINSKVVALSKALVTSEIKGLINSIPAYCSITVTYNPLEISYSKLCEEIEKLSATSLGDQNAALRVLSIPVCYEDGYSLDWEDVEKQTGLVSTEIIEIHTKTIFQVYMLGFLPGFVYMGSLPQSIAVARKTKPRLKVPSRSVGLAGLQTGIYPSEAPGGWQIIGRTPLDIFDGHKAEPFLFQAGDSVRFKSISPESYMGIEQEIKSSNFNFDEIYG